MRFIAMIVVMAALLMLPATASRAATMTFGGILSGANENPPTNSPGMGSVAVVLDPTAETIQIVASFFDLTTPDNAAHIHCCQTMPGMNENVGVATTLPTFAGFPLGVTQGTYLSPLFSLEDPSFFNPAFVAMEGGMEQAEAALIAGIENGQTYFNIHTTMNPGGEIRTELDPIGAPATPLPAALPLFATGLGALGLLGWRRKRKARMSLLEVA
jgi:hypothetical protein